MGATVVYVEVDAESLVDVGADVYVDVDRSDSAVAPGDSVEAVPLLEPKMLLDIWVGTMYITI